MSSVPVYKSPVAGAVPFDNATNGFTSTETQGAIEEAFSSAADTSRGPTIAGFDGTGTSGRWLEFFQNNPSNNSPFIVAENSQLVAISIVTASATATGNFRVFKNGVLLQDLALTAQKKNAISGLSHSLPTLSEISVQITSGSISRPQIYLSIKVLP
jgi:hypothetical protein